MNTFSVDDLLTPDALGAVEESRTIVPPPLDWLALEGCDPPARDWAVTGWLGMGHVTLLAGCGGVGKSLLAQTLASALTLRQHYIDDVPRVRRVLMWAAEDDHDELWRRQLAIAAHFRVPLSAFAEHLVLRSFCATDCTLMTTARDGTLIQTRMARELKAQVRDCGAEVVILDNSARLFGGSEINRHEVTTFIAFLNDVASGAAVLLLAHPGRATGSEYSGSSAWEASVRSRMFMSHRLPAAGQERDRDDELPEGDLRYLSRRKANYAARDLRSFRFAGGVLVPEGVSTGGSVVDALRDSADEQVVLDALAQLASMGQVLTDASNAPSYLPKLVLQFNLGQGRSQQQLDRSMRRLMVAGRVRRDVVGKYANRTDRYGLVVAAE